ncbi:hypothetical protein F5884DRAFT_741675 [Xylogone sp. PMI_703]|nr:hypothetical protein F5884DRAFT_741675 [Xylogone sp. PMI_703]
MASGHFMSKLTSKRVLILGGSSGIGFSVAQGALEQGAIVTVASSNQKRLDDALQRLIQTNALGADRCNGYTCDLSQPDAVENSVMNLLELATTQRQSKLDHIIFTAGDSFSVKPLKDTTLGEIQERGNVRFLGALMVAKHAPAYMNISSSSSINFTGGVNSIKPGSGWVVMAAYGAALEGMMRGLAVELKPIRVNMVSPGAVKTELFDRLIPADEMEIFLRDMADGTLTGEVGRPDDVAEAYLYLMKDRFVTGHMINSEGGRLLK